MQFTKKQEVTIDISPEEVADIWWQIMGNDEQVRFFNHLFKLITKESFGGNSEYAFIMQLQHITDHEELGVGGRWIMRKIGEYSEKSK